MNGCTQYKEATVNIFFEPDHVGCAWCPILETYARKQCRRTGEYIVDDRVVGRWCPLVFEHQEESTEELPFY